MATPAIPSIPQNPRARETLILRTVFRKLKYHFYSNPPDQNLVTCSFVTELWGLGASPLAPMFSAKNSPPLKKRYLEKLSENVYLNLSFFYSVHFSSTLKSIFSASPLTPTLFSHTSSELASPS